MRANGRRKLLTAADVMRLLKVTRRTVYRLIATRGFPRPLKVCGSNRWVAQEIDAWLAECPRAAMRADLQGRLIP